MKTYILFLNSASDYKINDQDGRVVGLARARKLWEAGQVNGSNQAFSRLANQFAFDLRSLKKFYKETPLPWAGPPEKGEPAKLKP